MILREGKVLRRSRQAGRHRHGENGSHGVQGGDEDPDLTDASGKQERPGRLTVCFPMTKDLMHTHKHTHRHTRSEETKGEISSSSSSSRCQHWANCCLVQVTCRKGTMPSRAMACNRRGAPVRLCSPAPQQEKKEPITMTQGEGHDRVPMTRFPFTESPNLN